MSVEQFSKRFEQALSSRDPFVSLNDLAKALKAEGVGQVAIYHLFAEFQKRIEGDDPRYDAIVDNMDLIWGGPFAKGRALFESELTSADIAKPAN